MEALEHTTEERRLATVSRLLGFVFAAMALGYLFQGVFGSSEYPFVANSTAKDGIFSVLCFAASADIRRNGWAISIVLFGHALLLISLLAMLVFGDISSVSGSFDAPPGFGLPGAEQLLFVWIGLAAGVTVLLAWLRWAASRARYSLSYLMPHQHRTAMALAEVLVVGEDEALTPMDVAAGIDDYLSSFSAQQKWKSKLALSVMTIYPMLRLRPPLPRMAPELRAEFLERNFIEDVLARRIPGFLRRPIQSVFVGALQLVYIGYYADPRSFDECGYVPFSKRPRYAKSISTLPVGREPLSVRSPGEVDADTLTADVVIVGSGAGGAIMAHRLAARGREVVLLERGPHIDPSDFTEDERKQFSDLYQDGALQMSTDTRFQVLQGMCVGGTTVVNNAVCFDLPPHVLERWNDPDGLDAGLDAGRLNHANEILRKWLPVSSQSGVILGGGGRKLEDGMKALQLDRDPWEFRVVDANIADCFGCGYCNIGCPYGKKLSALDTTLPRAQTEFGSEAVKIYSECMVERITKAGDAVTGVECRLSDGRRLTVSANTVVVSAGAIASSLLLQRSHIGGKLAGTGLGFNMGSPMTAEFDSKIDAYDGLQISHYLRPPGDDGLILETWFNPVGTQAMFMPGWFGDHYENMSKYDHMACCGSVVGTRRNATVRPGFRGRGMKLDYVPADDDVKRLIDGLKLAGRIYLAAGALKVMPNTYRYLPMRTDAELDELDRVIRDNTDIQLHSSHPQGGNAISRDPAKGVVDERFAVHGVDRLYVCDASVFPSPITVNPQLTVMALAEYAAAGIE